MATEEGIPPAATGTGTVPSSAPRDQVDAAGPGPTGTLSCSLVAQLLEHELIRRGGRGGGERGCLAGTGNEKMQLAFDQVSGFQRRTRKLMHDAARKRAGERVEQTQKVAQAQAAADVSRARREAEEKVLAMQKDSCDVRARALKAVCRGVADEQLLVNQCREVCELQIDEIQAEAVVQSLLGQGCRKQTAGRALRAKAERKLWGRCFARWVSRLPHHSHEATCRRCDAPHRSNLLRLQQENLLRLIERRRSRVQVARCVESWRGYARARLALARRSLRGIVGLHRRRQQTALLQWRCTYFSMSRGKDASIDQIDSVAQHRRECLESVQQNMAWRLEVAEAERLAFKLQLADEESRSRRVEEECACAVVQLGRMGEATASALVRARMRLQVAQLFGAWSRIYWMSMSIRVATGTMHSNH